MVEKEIYNLFVAVFVQWMKRILFSIVFMGLMIIQVLTSSKFDIIFFIISTLGVWALVIAIWYSDWKFDKEYKKLKEEYNKSRKKQLNFIEEKN